MTQHLYEPVSIEVGCLQKISDRQEPGYWTQAITKVKEKWIEHYLIYEIVASPPDVGIAKFTCQKCGDELLNLEFKSEQSVRREKMARFIICLAIALLGLTNAANGVGVLIGLVAGLIGLAYLIEAIRAVPELKIGKKLDLIKQKSTTGYYVTTDKHKYRKDGVWVYTKSFHASKRK